MADEIPAVPVVPDQRIITVAQDYIIIGKSTKDVEVRVNCDFSKYDESKRKIENGVRLAEYFTALTKKEIPLPSLGEKHE